MTLSRSLRFLLAAALLAVWQGSLVHPLEHVDESGGFVHLVDGHSSQDHGGQKNAPDPSCDVLAAVAACVSSSTGPVFAVPECNEALLARRPASSGSAPLLAYRGHAPPQNS